MMGPVRGIVPLVLAVCVLSACVDGQPDVVSGAGTSAPATPEPATPGSAGPATTATTRATPAHAATATPASSPSPDRLDRDDRVSLTGIGPVQVGMTLDEASRAAGQQIAEVPGSRIGPGGDCFYARPESRLPNVSFMVEDDRIVRVDVGHDSDVATVSGVRVGDTAEQVERVYRGRIVAEPHPYTAPEGSYLRYRADDARFSLIFETMDGRVQSYRSGFAEHVARIEGCA